MFRLLVVQNYTVTILKHWWFRIDGLLTQVNTFRCQFRLLPSAKNDHVLARFSKYILKKYDSLRKLNTKIICRYAPGGGNCYYIRVKQKCKLTCCFPSFYLESIYFGSYLKPCHDKIHQL